MRLRRRRNGIWQDRDGRLMTSCPTCGREVFTMFSCGDGAHLTATDCTITFRECGHTATFDVVWPPGDSA